MTRLRLTLLAILVVGSLSSAGRAADPLHNFDDLLKALSAATVEGRVEAAEGLAQLGKDASAAIPALVKALADPHADARSAAARALGEIGRDDEVIVEALLRLLEDVERSSNELPVWATAATALGKLGTRSVPRLVDRLSSDHVVVRRGAAIALHGIGTPAQEAIPKLVELLEQNDPETRIAAMYGIQGIGSQKAVAALPSLLSMLSSDDFHTQYWACRMIGGIGAPDALEAIPKLLELTENGVASVRSNAADAIGQIGPTAGERVVRPLENMLKDRVYVVRRAGVIALGRLGEVAATSVADLRTLRETPELSVRAEAAAALWQITGESADNLDVLLAELQSPDTPWEAALAFQRLGSRGKPATAELARVLESTNSETQYFAMLSLIGIGPEANEALLAIRKLLDSPDEDMRKLAQRTIDQWNAPPLK